MKLHIAPDLELPVDAVTEAIAVLGIRRSGKSYTVRRLAEQLVKASQQVIILDPKGDWWGIRSSADGKAAGLPITILGGEHGDIPLEAGAGEIIAKLAVEENVSMLLDLSEFRKNEIPRFVTGFLETMYRLKAAEKYRTPVMLIIDEADAIAPQRPFKGEERMLGAAEDIVRRGGQRGIGCTMATQRPAVLNKNVLTQCPTLIALRTTGSQDIDAIDEWIKKHGNPEKRKLLMDSIAMLPTGDAWFWSPAWPTPAGIFQRAHVLPIETFDSGATPKAGEKRKQPKGLAPVDLDALRERMAATIERQKADDPKALRARIAELERDLKKKLTPGRRLVAGPPDRAAIEQATIKAAAQAASQIGKEFVAIVAPLRKEVSFVIAHLRNFADRLEKVLPPEKLDLRATLDLPKSDAQPNAARGTDHPHATNTARQEIRRQREASASNGANGSMPRPQQRILDGLAWLESIRLNSGSRNIVAFLADASPKSSAFMNNLGALRGAGMIDYPTPGDVSLTDAGRGAAVEQDTPLTSKELHARIYDKLPQPQCRILGALIRHRGSSLSREELAQQAGASPASSAYMNNLGALRSLGLISYPSQGQVQAGDILFLEG